MPDEVTALEVTAKVADVAPAAIVTEVGTVARVVDELVNVTTSPPAGAAELMLTVPVMDVVDPPMTVDADSDVLEIVGNAGV